MFYLQIEKEGLEGELSEECGIAQRILECYIAKGFEEKRRDVKEAEQKVEEDRKR